MASFEFHRPPMLARAEFDRGDEIRKSPERLVAGWADALVLRIDHQGRFAVTGDGAIAWEAAVGERPPSDAVFIGVDGVHRWAVRADEVAGDVADARTGSHRLSPDEAGMLATALGILNWHRAAQFSPVDGDRVTAVNGGWILRTGAGDEFPRTDPAVIMLVHDGADQILLGRQAVWPDKWFSTLAGFVEPGESLEQCVRREVAEEAGITVTDPRYLGSQPWPFPRSLMLGFEAVGDPTEPLEFRDGELADAQWFHRDEVLDALERGADWGADVPDLKLMLPAGISIARNLVEAWAHAPR
ncbi:putative NADH pyrophosphatase/NUDIX hydrolase [Gordonia spumicola]|uniref:NAD(+) diphosphatase n=1 Tax=Gordonia spumicola TaxID=589161 RepID=A0A7I9VF47_9ACTN|nr:NAD(+) diphosphatase [Gordonia spumicola]GEE03946.1 putative NADH pyrophosphatase/NUDIX hydrolase [Gordonia spumicola]